MDVVQFEIENNKNITIIISIRTVIAVFII